MRNILPVTLSAVAMMTAAIAADAIAADAIAADASSPPAAARSVFARNNLVAWCIVPFDVAKRGPEERAAMLARLGIERFAYDWRPEHVATFEAEVVAMKSRGIEYTAFWGFHADIVPVLERHNIKPQFWMTAPSPKGANENEQVVAAADQLAPMVARTAELGCKLGLYNHGGWGGEPDNLVAVVKHLRQRGNAQHVGIVYNFHHAHDHIADFSQALQLMQPYLLCINLNGMAEGGNPKILPLGSGQHEKGMMEAIRSQGYQGPIGIIGHRAEVDAEDALRANLAGLKRLLAQMGDQAALASFD